MLDIVVVVEGTYVTYDVTYDVTYVLRSALTFALDWHTLTLLHFNARPCALLPPPSLSISHTYTYTYTHTYTHTYTYTCVCLTLPGLISLFSMLGEGGGQSSGIKVLRILRVLRPLRAAHHIPQVCCAVMMEVW